MAERLDQTKLAAARLIAADRYPFLAVALYALSPVATPGLGTFAVDDRWRLYIDPEALARWDTEEVAGVLLHELSHVVRHHGERARASFVDETTKRAWNIAADAEINDDLLADRVRLPETAVTPKVLGMPSSKAAEYYYARLIEAGNVEFEGHDCGAGCHGVDDPATGTHRRPRDLPIGLAADEADLMRRQVALAVLGKQAGTESSGWSRWAASFLEPVVDWRRLFGAAVRRAVAGVVAGRSDYRYHRPPRRRVPKVVLPSLVRPIPRIAAVIDTSGSVDEAQLNRAWSEVLGMMRGVGVRPHQIALWSVDTEAHRITMGNDRSIELLGGGGTDMGIGIRAAIDDAQRPDVVVVLTDGYTPWPENPPGRPVVVGLLGGGEDVPKPPWWATVIVIPSE